MRLKDFEIYRGVYSYRVSAFDKEQAIELFKENFKNDEKSEKIRITRICSGDINIKGDRNYILFFRLDGSKNIDRPNCIECGSKNVISKGVMWLCKDCGRWFKKIRR